MSVDMRSKSLYETTALTGNANSLPGAEPSRLTGSSGQFFGLLDASLEPFGRTTYLAAGAAAPRFLEPTAGVGYFDAAFGTGDGDALVFHHEPP